MTIRKILIQNNIQTRSSNDFNRVITPEFESIVYELYTIHKNSQREISNILKCSVDTIHRCLKNMGVALRSSGEINQKGETLEKIQAKELYATGLSYSDVAKNFGVTASTIRNWMKELNIPLRSVQEVNSKCSEEDKRRIIQLYANGFSTPEIADILGLKSHKTVLYWLHKQGITVRTNTEAKALAAELGKSSSRAVKCIIHTKFGDIPVESSYEAARIYQLLQNPDIINIQRAKRILMPNNKYYIPDLEVTYANGNITIEEIKPLYLLNNNNVIYKKNYALEYYENINIKYQIITEYDIGGNYFLSLLHYFQTHEEFCSFKNDSIKMKFVRVLKQANSYLKTYPTLEENPSYL